MGKIYRFQLFLIVCFFLSFTELKAEEPHYTKSYNEIVSMLSETTPLSFQKAVFLTENAYLERKMDAVAFDNIIQFYASLSSGVMQSGEITYTEKDKEIAMAQCAVFIFMSDSVQITTTREIVTHEPFVYNYSDFAGQKDWSSTFVSTLMQTQKGNCHSLPYLYKIIMNKLGYESHLALAPNHIYIKANNKKVGWYNIELTCGDFPTDAWLMASGYIHTDAIRNGTYMRALSEKESVAMTLVDLAQGYQAKFGIEDGNFMLMCCNTTLKHFPNYINALLLKGEILTELYRKSEDPELMSQMTELYTHIHELGYRKMPDEMYMKWLDTLKDNTDSRMKSVIVKR